MVAPLGVPGADLANFAGYVAWSAWVLALAVLKDRLLPTLTPAAPDPSRSTPVGPATS